MASNLEQFVASENEAVVAAGDEEVVAPEATASGEPGVLVESVADFQEAPPADEEGEQPEPQEKKMLTLDEKIALFEKEIGQDAGQQPVADSPPKLKATSIAMKKAVAPAPKKTASPVATSALVEEATPTEEEEQSEPQEKKLLTLEEKIALFEKEIGQDAGQEPVADESLPSKAKAKSTVAKKAAVASKAAPAVPADAPTECVPSEEQEVSEQPPEKPLLSLDERLAAAEKEMGMSAFPPTEDAVDSRPIAERVADKNWKARLQAYEFIKTSIAADREKGRTACFEEFGSFLKTMASDSNAGALDAGLDAVLSYLIAYEDEICPEGGAPGSNNFQASLGIPLCTAIIDKAFGSSKVSSVAKGKAVIMKLIELTNDPVGTTAATAATSGISYINTVLLKLNDKRPKVPPYLLEIAIDCFAAFGCSPNKTNPVGTASYTAVLLKECISTVFPTILINATSSKFNKPTKDLCNSLLITVCKYMSYGSCTETSIPIPAPIQATIVGMMKPAQKADFDKLLAAALTTPSASVIGEPTVYLKRDRSVSVAKAAAANATGGAAASRAIGGSSDDMREFLAEVDLLKKMKAELSDYNSKIGEITPSATGKVAPTKWSLQLEGLNMIIGFIGPAPKCRPLASYTDGETALVTSIFRDKIMDTLKYFLSPHNATSTHITLQVHSIKIYMLLADAYRAEFTSYARQTLSNLLQKYKDKKLVNYVSACLLAYLRFCPAFSLSDLHDDLKELVANKKSPPHCVIGIVEMLSIVMQELVRTDSRVLKPEQYKAVHADLLLPRCEDSDVKIREAATSAMLLFAQFIKEKKTASDTSPKDVKFVDAAYKLLTACQTSHPKLYKKVEALLASSKEYTVPRLTTASLLPETAGAAAAAVSSSSSSSSATASVAAAIPVTTASAAATSSGLKRPATKAIRPPPSADVSAPAAVAKPKPTKVAACDEEDAVPSEALMSIEDATICLGQLGVSEWDSSVQELWGTGKWQDKVQVLTLLADKFREPENAHLGGFYSEALVAYLAHHSPKFKISNMNVLKAYISVVITSAGYSSSAAVGCDVGSVTTTTEALTSLSVDDESPVAAGPGATSAPVYKPFSRSAAWVLIRYLIADKMADKKYQAQCTELLTALAESISPIFVMKRMGSMLVASTGGTKGGEEGGSSSPTLVVAPAAHQCFLEWCKVTVADFGVSRLAVQPGGGSNALASVNSMIQYMVTHIILPETDHKLAGVRSAAIEFAGSIYAQLGPRLLTLGIFSDDMKSQVKGLLESEFEKVKFDPASLSKMVFVRKIKPQTLVSAADNATAGGTTNVKGQGGSGSADESPGTAAAASSDEFPRMDVLSMLSAATSSAAGKDGASSSIAITSANVVDELNNISTKTSWQNRKAAIEALTQACEKSGYYIEYNRSSLEPVMKALARRVTSDINANLKPLAATCLGVLIASMNMTDAARCMKMYSDALLSGLGDNNKRLRDHAIMVLQMCCTLNPKLTVTNPAPEGTAVHSALVNTMIPSGIVDVLSTNNVGGRLELLNWCISVAGSVTMPPTKASESKEPFAELLLVCIKHCLQDKLGTVRNAAEQFLVLLAQGGMISKSLVESTMRLELTPAMVRNTQGYLDKVLAAFDQPASTASASTPAAPSSHAAADKPPPAVKKSVTATTAPPVPPSNTAANVKKAPAAAPISAAAAPTPAVAVPAAEPDAGLCGGFRKSANRLRRSEEFVTQSTWPQPPEEVGESEYQQLRSAWEPLITTELAELLFPSSVILGGSGGNLAGNNLVSSTDICISAVDHMTTHLLLPVDSSDFNDCVITFAGHLDLLLRWCSLMLVTKGMLRESTGGTNKLLTFIIALLDRIAGHNAQCPGKGAASTTIYLTDGEIGSIVPHLIDKSGHKSERHRAMYRQLLCAVGAVIKPVNKFTQLLIAGLSCKNKKSRIVSLEVIQYILENITGNISTTLHRASIKEIGAHFDSKDTDLLGRSAGLELTYTMYHLLHMQYFAGAPVVYNNQVVHKLLKLLSSGTVPSLTAAASSHDNTLSERISSMIDDRIKSKLKEGKLVHIVGSNMHGSCGSSNGAAAATAAPNSPVKEPVQAGPAHVPTAMANRRTSGGKSSLPSPSPAKQSASKQSTATTASAAVDSDEDDDKPFMALMQTPAKTRVKSRKPVVPMATTPPQEEIGAARTWGDVASPEAAAHSATPAATLSRTPPGNTAGTPAAFNLTETPGDAPHALSPPAAAHPHAVLESVYVDILTKVDEMLATERATTAGGESSDSGLLYRQTSIEVVATDYIKLLHTIISNHSSSDTKGAVGSEDLIDGSGSVGGAAASNTVLLRYIVPLVDRLMLCLDRAFSNSPGCSTIDVNLTSICLATLFTVIKHKDLIAHVLSSGEKSAYLYSILRCCLTKLVDSRLLTGAGAASASAGAFASEPTDYYILHEYNVSIIRALNLILLKLSSTSGSSGAPDGSGCSCELLICLLRVLYNTSSTASPVDALPDSVTKPTSRLVLKVLSEEVRKPSPFVAAGTSDPYASTLQLLNMLHELFGVHPPTASAGAGSANDTAFCTAKTIAFQMVKTVGIERLSTTITAPSAAVRISPTLNKDSYIFRLLQRLHSNAVNTSSANNTPQKVVRATESPTPPAAVTKSPTNQLPSPNGESTKTATSTPNKRPAASGKMQRTPPVSAPVSTTASVPTTAPTTIASAAAVAAAAAGGADGDLMARFANLKRKA